MAEFEWIFTGRSHYYVRRGCSQTSAIGKVRQPEHGGPCIGRMYPGGGLCAVALEDFASVDEAKRAVESLAPIYDAMEEGSG